MKRYKVIIADDNPLIRQSLVQTIKWEACRCEVVAEAEDGLVEKRLIKDQHPDIIISDIRMPGMDGLAVSEYVLGLGGHALVIIITGYNEFEYAHKALKLGVFDFLLKPIKNEELEKLLGKAVAQLENTEKEQERQKQLVQENYKFKEIIQDADNIIRDQLLSDLAHGQQGNESARRLGDYSRMEKKKYAYVIGRLRSTDESICGSAIGVLREIISSMGDECRFIESRADREIEFLYSCDKSVSASIFNIRIKKKLLEINRTLQETRLVAICFAVSNICEDMARLHEMRVQVWKVLENNYFSAKEIVLFFRHYNLFEIKEGDVIIQSLDSFYKSLEHSGTIEAEEEIEQMLNNIVEHTQGNEFQIKCFLSEICITLYRHYNLGKLPQQEYDKNINEVLNEINYLQGIECAKVWMVDYVARLCQMADPLKQFDNPLAGNAVQYIKNNYNNQELSLTAASMALNVNASYLSRLLKKETGMNFSDILTTVRISKAKQLLQESGSRAAEVGSKVGYKDYTYFYQVFKKTEGISPTEYKKIPHNLLRGRES